MKTKIKYPLFSGDIGDDAIEPKVTYDLIEGHLPPPGLTVLPGYTTVRSTNIIRYVSVQKFCMFVEVESVAIKCGIVSVDWSGMADLQCFIGNTF